ncbi:hypothetical protein RUM44_010675 [Polyplax serrata]|uniref:MRG-binding protein n=1 Tax=Polyplax serrata TaxID=468196 RepID=A0ABR1AN65_POLSC
MASDEGGKVCMQENFEWNVENEIKLFEAIIGHKPVGINKHFHMACISEKFENMLGKPISSDILWQHLGSMYDLAALDKKDTLPFPNEPVEFSLPDAEYLDLINEKMTSKTDSVSDSRESSKEVKCLPKHSKDLTPAKESTIKKEKSESEDSLASADTEKKETIESESDSKKGNLSKEIKTRGKRSLKDKKMDDDTPTTPVSVKKKEESSLSNSASKKEKQAVGKRTLRSRVDDSFPNKSLTPPPVKRARRL